MMMMIMAICKVMIVMDELPRLDGKEINEDQNVDADDGDDDEGVDVVMTVMDDGWMDG